MNDNGYIANIVGEIVRGSNEAKIIEKPHLIELWKSENNIEVQLK